MMRCIVWQPHKKELRAGFAQKEVSFFFLKGPVMKTQWSQISCPPKIWRLKSLADFCLKHVGNKPFLLLVFSTINLTCGVAVSPNKRLWTSFQRQMLDGKSVCLVRMRSWMRWMMILISTRNKAPGRGGVADQVIVWNLALKWPWWIQLLGQVSCVHVFFFFFNFGRVLLIEKNAWNEKTAWKIICQQYTVLLDSYSVPLWRVGLKWSIETLGWRFS